MEGRWTMMKLITVKVDKELASEYRETYLKAFKNKKVSKLTDVEFLRVFVEDRLREEIDFLRKEPT